MRFALALFFFAHILLAATVKRDIEYVHRPSGPLLLDASIPDGPGPFKAIVIVHGGGFSKGNKGTFVPPLFPPLTKAGFAWFTIDYRLAPAATVQDQVQDVRSALSWIREHAAQYRVDSKRIALMGESAGAYLVDWVGLTESADTSGKEAPVAAVVSFYGPADLVRQFAGKPVPEPMRAFFGVTSTESQEQKLRELSPIHQIHRHAPPFLLLHGDADEQVPYEESPAFCDALKAQGDRCELFTVVHGLHGIGRWEGHADQQAYKRNMIDWLNDTMR